ncbi:MAG: hypothetical protein PSX36_00490 [bacterium]|nr:hypothetical protein [bacterium]
MKDVFLVHFILPEVIGPGFYALIPKHRQRIQELLEKRILLSYALDMDRKNVWAVFQADGLREVRTLLSSLPIIQEVKVKIHELAFHDSAPISLPGLIMN